MKSSASRKDLKSLVKECVREVMFEEGMISDLVSEIAGGFAKANLLEVNQSPLTGIAPNDSGIDISAIPGMNNWKHLIK